MRIIQLLSFYKLNPHQNKSEFLENLYLYRLISGNTYVLSASDTNKLPKEIYSLRPDRVNVIAGIFYQLDINIKLAKENKFFLWIKFMDYPGFYTLRIVTPFLIGTVFLQSKLQPIVLISITMQLLGIKRCCKMGQDQVAQLL